MKRTNKYWLMSTEWDADTPMASQDFPQYRIHLYPNITEGQLEQIKSDCEKYSPYDYLDFDEFDNERDFNEHVQYMASKGAIIEN